MIPDPLCYQLLLVGLVWLCLLLHVVWPYDRAPSGPTTPRPAKAPCKRSKAPTPFSGLLHKPPCAACEQQAVSPPLPPLAPPVPMSLPTRRPRQVDTSMHFCPQSNCDYRGWVGLGNLRANGHPNGGPWRQFHCTACTGYFLETHGTIFHGKRMSVERIVRSCTPALLIIPSAQKPGKMPHLTTRWRGQCHGLTPVFLPTRSVGHHLA